ncbi:MAG: hypothetical protein WA979_02215 [Pacificimonas sp.]
MTAALLADPGRAVQLARWATVMPEDMLRGISDWCDLRGKKVEELTRRDLQLTVEQMGIWLRCPGVCGRSVT